MSEQTETRRQVAERIAAPTIGKVAPAVYHEIIDAIEAALKDRDDEIERLREQLNDPCLVAGYHVCGGVHDLSKRSW